MGRKDGIVGVYVLKNKPLWFGEHRAYFLYLMNRMYFQTYIYAIVQTITEHFIE